VRSGLTIDAKRYATNTITTVISSQEGGLPKEKSMDGGQANQATGAVGPGGICDVAETYRRREGGDTQENLSVRKTSPREGVNNRTKTAKRQRAVWGPFEGRRKTEVTESTSVG